MIGKWLLMTQPSEEVELVSIEDSASQHSIEVSTLVQEVAPPLTCDPGFPPGISR